MPTSYGFLLNISSQIGKDNIHPTGRRICYYSRTYQKFQLENNMQVSLNNNTSTSKYKYTGRIWWTIKKRQEELSIKETVAKK